MITRTFKKAVVILVLFLFMFANAYAVNVVDTMTCKKVVLLVNQRAILVQRLTGYVKYLLRSNGEWKLLRGRGQKVYQRLYNAQASAEKKQRSCAHLAGERG
ncbi:MAG: hypothetical protein WC335_03810 [Candidatus Omnitrophota bacterium]